MNQRFASRAAAAVLILALAAFAWRAHADENALDAPYPVDLTVGETFQVCDTGLILCPAIAPICDDPKVAIPVDTPKGLGFQAVGPGTTLCSALPPGGLAGRVIFRITVRAKGDDR